MKTNTLTLSIIISSILVLFSIVACNDYSVTTNGDVEFKNLDFDYNNSELSTSFDTDVVALGRVMFYDNILSKNGNVSCASCHKQEFSFADDLVLSDGFLKGKTLKNTPGLINLEFGETFFWDARSFDLNEAVIMPIFDHLEMGMTEEELVSRIDNTEYYDDLFANAYGDKKASKARIANALAEFVGSIISIDSELDAFLKSDDANALSQVETNGLKLFEQHCNTCHTALGDAEFDTDGQTTNNNTNDNPYMGTGNSSLVSIGLDNVDIRNRMVRIPSLRNIGSTAPYMHDGRFESLDDVIDHYDRNINDNDPTLDFRLRENGRALRLNLSSTEKNELKAFLLTLSDDAVETDERWSNPFVQ
jgi:cytochrome c peroxidase